MEAYPFLWGKSEQFDRWTRIAEPAFLQVFRGKARDIMDEAHRGERPLTSNEASLVSYDDPEHGFLDVVYREVSGTVLGGFRPLNLIEGFILCDRVDSPQFCARHFDDARSAIEFKYEQFLEASRNQQPWTHALASHNKTISVVTPAAGEAVLVLQRRTAEPVHQHNRIPTSVQENTRTGSTSSAPPNFLRDIEREILERQRAEAQRRNGVRPKPSGINLESVVFVVGVAGAVAFLVGLGIYLVRKHH